MVNVGKAMARKMESMLLSELKTRAIAAPRWGLITGASQDRPPATQNRKRLHEGSRGLPPAPPRSMGPRMLAPGPGAGAGAGHPAQQPSDVGVGAAGEGGTDVVDLTADAPPLLPSSSPTQHPLARQRLGVPGALEEQQAMQVDGSGQHQVMAGGQGSQHGQGQVGHDGLGVMQPLGVSGNQAAADAPGDDSRHQQQQQQQTNVAVMRQSQEQVHDKHGPFGELLLSLEQVSASCTQLPWHTSMTD